MVNHENFLSYIDLIGDNIYQRLGFRDTFIVFFRHGYKSTELEDDYAIVSWEKGSYVFSHYFYAGQRFHIIDNAISITELRRLLNARIYDFIGKGE